MTPFDIISSGVPAVVVPVEPGIAVLSVLAALVISIGVLSFASVSSSSRNRERRAPAGRTATSPA